MVTMSDPFSMRERKCSSLRRNASSAYARSMAVARTFATAWRKCVSWIVNSRGCAVCTPRIPKGRALPCTRTLRLDTTPCADRSAALPNRASVARSSTTTGPVERSTYPACESASAGNTVRPTAPSRQPTPARRTELEHAGERDLEHTRHDCHGTRNQLVRGSAGQRPLADVGHCFLLARGGAQLRLRPRQFCVATGVVLAQQSEPARAHV